MQKTYNKEKLSSLEALDLIRKKLNREMSYRWEMWKDPRYAHEYYVVADIRRFVKDIIKKVSKGLT